VLSYRPGPPDATAIAFANVFGMNIICAIADDRFPQFPGVLATVGLQAYAVFPNAMPSPVDGAVSFPIIADAVRDWGRG